MALEKREIDVLADISERHSIFNYAVLHSGVNNLFLWRPETVAIMNFVRDLRRRNGEPVFYSMNTGANVFIYCFTDNARRAIEEGLDELSVEHCCSRVGKALKYHDMETVDGPSGVAPLQKSAAN